jgi:hypothetical protein
MMAMKVVELQASAALLLWQFDRNLRWSGALAGETTPARNRSTIVAFIDHSLQAWICFVFVTLSNLEVCQFRWWRYYKNLENVVRGEHCVSKRDFIDRYSIDFVININCYRSLW